MNAETIAILRETWRAVTPVADDALTLFYGRLFAIDPSARALFAQSDMAEQRTKLAEAITLVIDGLDHLDDVAPVLADLGRRHVAYGVTAAHYDSVGEALLWAPQRGLGAAWTPAAKRAWTDGYGLIAGTMRQAAATAGRRPAAA